MDSRIYPVLPALFTLSAVYQAALDKSPGKAALLEFIIQPSLTDSCFTDNAYKTKVLSKLAYRLLNKIENTLIDNLNKYNTVVFPSKHINCPPSISALKFDDQQPPSEKVCFNQHINFAFPLCKTQCLATDIATACSLTMHWNRYSFSDLGLTFTAGSDPEAESTQVFSVSNTGNWSTKEYLPMAYLEDTEAGVSLYWQIEHNGSWHWEISDYEGQYYLELGGPDELHNHWWKQLMPGETFVSVPACIGVETAGMDRAMAALTEYRRRIRRPNRDNEQLSVIFNDYMNCLSGDPTTQKELEMIPKAREAGCEYFVVDCGWYADGAWWDGVGEWRPSEKRFPGGFKEVMDAIRDAGMIPGAWLELEVMGVNCPLAKQLPDSWFFMRHGRRVCDKGRYQLDFRNAEVRDYAERVIDRMVNEYGVGYIKMDYNIEPGTGTDQQADSTGQGLLEHNRAYLAWIDHIFEKYPELVIENCSSGGMRTDYAMLARHSLQSTSDQTDYRQYATLAANAPAAVTPEQAAVWSYPLTDGDEEETIFNMVNAMLLRIHQSGHLVNLSPARFALVKEGIACYKSIRQDIRRAVPFWPLGLSSYGDSWVSLGLKAGNKNYIAVWRSDSGNDTCLLPISHLRGKDASVKCLYPQNAACRCAWHKESGELAVELPVNISARLFEVSANE